MTATINPASTLLQQLNNNNSSLAQAASTAAGTAAAVANTSPTALQNNFMTLLVTQLQNQNPLNPMDSAQMTSQLAQISTVSGISQLNSTLQSLNSSLTSNQSMTAATSLIGHQVLVPGNTIALTSGATASGGVTLPQAVDSLTVQIKNSAGATVSTLSLGPQQAGVVPFTWNGIDNSGQAVPSGTYQIVASAIQGGNAVTATALSSGQVGSVTMGSQGASLDLGALGAVNLSSVAYIK